MKAKGKNTTRLSPPVVRDTRTGHRMTAPLFLILFAFLISGTVFLQAQDLHQVRKNLRQDFNLDAETIIVSEFSVRRKGETVPFFITFSGGQSGNTDERYLSDGTHELYYGIYDDEGTRNLLKDIGDNPDSNEVLSGTVGGANRGWAYTDASYTVIVFYDQFPPAGQYSDTVRLSLYRGTVEELSAAELVDSEEISITVKIDPILDIALVPTGLPFDETRTDLTLDFGELRIGSVREGDIMVRSNAVYSLSLSSANGGKMSNADPADSSVVPYTFSVEGSGVSLPAGTETVIASNDGPTAVTGERYTIQVRIEDFGMATEGLYNDVITVSVVAQ